MENIGENNIQNQKKKKTIIVLSSVIALLLILGGIFGVVKDQQSQAEKKKVEYANSLAKTSADMNIGFLLSSLTVSSYSDVWRNAIDNSRDFNEKISDFKDDLSENGLLEQLEEGRDKLRENMKLLQNPPEEYMETYIVIKQMYGVYTKMVDQALLPTGSLMDFNRKTNDLYSQFEQQQEELLITIPADVKKLKEDYEKSKADEKEEQIDQALD